MAKRYLAERGSSDFEAFLDATQDECVICPLGVMELESVLRRLQRQRIVDAAFALRTRRSFASDLASAVWSVRPFDAAAFARGNELLRDLASPLTTLDALHLACALELNCNAMATGDAQLARAASECRLTVHSFVI